MATEIKDEEKKDEPVKDEKTEGSAKDEKEEKISGEALEEFFSLCLTVVSRFFSWLFGDNEQLGVTERTVDWIKFILIGFFGAGIVIPAVTLAFGFFFACFGSIPWYYAMLGVVGLGVLAESILFCIKGTDWQWTKYVIWSTLLAATVLVIPLAYGSSPTIIAQTIMVIGVLAFGFPALLIASFGVSFIAALIHRFFWKKVKTEDIALVIQDYFCVLVWILVFEELFIILGVHAPWKAILFGSLGFVIWMLMSFVFGWSLSFGKWIAAGLQVILMIWAIGVSIPSGISLRLINYDINSEWSFRSANPIDINHEKFVDTENKLAEKKAKKVDKTLEEIQRLIREGNTEEADKTLKGLKEEYGENPVIPRTAEAIENKAKETYHKIEEKLSK